MNRRQLLTRFTIVGGIWMLLQVYVGLHLVGQTGLAGWSLVLGWCGMLGLGGLPLGVLVASRRPDFRGKQALEWAGYVVLGLSSMLVAFYFLADILPWSSVGIATLHGSLAILGGAVVLTAVGVVQAQRPRVVRVPVPIADLPPDLAGLRIVQLSDLHVGTTIRRDFVRAVVETANGLAPDLVALTGDVADGYVGEMREHVAPLATLRAPLGRFFVTGNHEYYWDPVGWTRELGRLGFDVLSNEHRLIVRGRGRLLLAGVPDLSAFSDPREAVSGAPESDVRVLLAHQPRSAYAARDAGFDLQLSGHTHGGQYFPFNILVRLFQPFVAGLHRLERMWLYVSRGTGYWGPPLRLGAPAEITLLELIPA